MKIISAISLCVVALITVACSNPQAKQRKLAEKIVGEWTGKTIVLPEAVPCLQERNEVDCPPLAASFRILSYVDSAGCSACKLKLNDWKQIMHEVDSLMPGQVDFLFYFNPKSQKQVSSILRQHDFQHPVYADLHNRIGQLNHFSTEIAFQCFLLDRHNKVLLIGNPARNPKMWALYKQLITGQEAQKPLPGTVVQVEQAQIDMGKLAMGKRQECAFVLHNKGGQPLVVSDVKASCGCTQPSWSKQPTAPGTSLRIAVGVEPDETGYFQKSIDVYANVEGGVVRLSIAGMVE